MRTYKPKEPERCPECGEILDRTCRDHFDWWPYCGRYCHDKARRLPPRRYDPKLSVSDWNKCALDY